ncbi:hypothetical protein DH2020_037070 [Rehmannia glutinosa]|uniref:TPX2 C-terminal domain-containing protein n=1 Tax=Rehmannia glutinosa TaxID=99300 RepID=A0ABR0V535_REHGL
MDSSSKIGGAVTPAKEKTTRSKLNDSLRHSENVNPNVSSPGLKFSNSPSIVKSEKTAKKSASRNPNVNQVALALASPSPKKKIRERKFVIAKKKLRNEELDCVACEKCKKATGKSKCLCVAYESLRASQEEFFKNRSEVEDEVYDKIKEFDVVAEKEGVKPGIDTGSKGKMEENDVSSETKWETKDGADEVVVNGDMGVKRSRDRLLEEAKEADAIPGSGRVMNLVKEFEKLSMLKLGDAEEKEVEEVKQPPNASEMQRPGSISTMTSAGGRKLRRSSTESSGNRTRRHWKRKQPKATSQKPFMLRTEERGRCKEEEFMKKLRQMMEEEEKMRIPMAQGLPWTTDEPECLVKPPVKENTRPIDLILHSDVRAVERSEFDHQLAEEEEIRRLRKELVPKAQPLPYFDRPFIPRRSMKQPTIPKEPKFHIPEHKKIKCYLSLDDLFAQRQ